MVHRSKRFRGRRTQWRQAESNRQARRIILWRLKPPWNRFFLARTSLLFFIPFFPWQRSRRVTIGWYYCDAYSRVTRVCPRTRTIFRIYGTCEGRGTLFRYRWSWTAFCKIFTKIAIKQFDITKKSGNIAPLRNYLHLYLFIDDGLKNLNNNISFNFIT